MLSAKAGLATGCEDMLRTETETTDAPIRKFEQNKKRRKKKELR